MQTEGVKCRVSVQVRDVLLRFVRFSAWYVALKPCRLLMKLDENSTVASWEKIHTTPGDEPESESEEETRLESHLIHFH